MTTFRSILFLSGLIVCKIPCSIAGDIVKVSRTVHGFDRIHMANGGNVFLTQGDDESLIVEVDEDFLGDIVTGVHNNELTLEYLPEPKSSEYGTPDPLNYYLEVIDLHGIQISGSGQFSAERLVTDKLQMVINGSGNAAIGELNATALDAQIRGSGEVELKGRAGHQMIDIRGSGKYRAPGLIGKKIEIDIFGSGKGVLDASKALDIRISGSGVVEYSGQPDTTIEVNGAGRAVNTDSN